jgi:uncharacterized protein YecE (DUF72 family)
MRGRCFIGTSGWSYDHWDGLFYPSGTRCNDRLKYFTGQFDTVEINNTFYRLPRPSVFETWERIAPNGFIYALKGSRFITHMKKLKDPKEPIAIFIERARLLKDNLGPILFQLPPRWRCNPSRLKSFIKYLPQNMRFAFEFRDPDWFNEEVYGMLRKGDFAFCIYHMPDLESPVEVTASFTYIRFHGAGTLYSGRYTRGYLSRWADTIRGFTREGIDVYAYFNNDAYGHAIVNAKELIELLG